MASPSTHNDVTRDAGLAGQPAGVRRQPGGHERRRHKDVRRGLPRRLRREGVGRHEVTYKATVKEVRHRVLPELDDEFAKDLGEFESLAALRDRVRADLQEEARENNTPAAPRRPAEAAGLAAELRPAGLAGRARDRPPSGGIRAPADAAEHRSAPGRHRLGAVPRSAARAGHRLGGAARSCSTKSRGARQLTVTPEEVDKEIERFAERAGRTPAALRAQLEKEGGVARLLVGLRREKAVDLAMSRATITTPKPTVRSRGRQRHARPLIHDATTDCVKAG